MTPRRGAAGRLPGAGLLAALLLAAAPAAADQPGRFDYYVLSLSWSPHYCALPQAGNETLQCQERRYGFVVHGLWPQREREAPQFCGGQPGKVKRETVEEYLPIMPSRQLIEHQWRKHGTCSGLTQDQYFAATRRAWDRFRPPAAFADGSLVRTDRRTLLAEIRGANPDIPEDAIALRCRGRDFAEARLCLSRGLAPRVCGPSVRGNCPATGLRVRPLR